MGGIAVDIFFCASGFLVAGSLIASQSARDFIVARALRIYPGLWTALLLSVVAIGMLESSYSIAGFFSSIDTWKYLAKNAVMVLGDAVYLPGAFENNPLQGAVNGSLWTLPLELRAYLVLVAIWLLATALRRVVAVTFSQVCIVATAAVAGFAIWSIFAGQPNKFFTLLVVFLLGVVFRLFGRWITLNVWAAAAILLVLSAILSLDLRLFRLAYIFALPYLLLCLVYLPSGRIRKFNEVGDYSYGIYIYAFPIQQFLVAGWVSSVAGLITASFVTTLLMAVLSWHLVEKKSLALRERTRKS